MRVERCVDGVLIVKSAAIEIAEMGIEEDCWLLARDVDKSYKLEISLTRRDNLPKGKLPNLWSVVQPVRVIERKTIEFE